MPDVPTLYDYLEAARKVADGSDPLAIAKLARGREGPVPKPAEVPSNVTPLRKPAPAARQGGLGL